MNPWTDNLGMGVGGVTVHTSSNGGHPVEFYAERIINKLIYIGKDAPEPIRLQAEAYREQMLSVVLDGLKRAIDSDRRYRKD